MPVKSFILITGLSLLCFYSNAQTRGEKIKNLINDTATKEKAAKADVYVIKKSIFDTVALIKPGVKAVPAKKNQLKIQKEKL